MAGVWQLALPPSLQGCLCCRGLRLQCCPGGGDALKLPSALQTFCQAAPVPQGLGSPPHTLTAGQDEPSTGKGSYLKYLASKVQRDIQREDLLKAIQKIRKSQP